MSWIINRQKKLWIATAVLALLHLIGFIGLHSAFAEQFAALTSLNLLISFILVLLFANSISKELSIFFVFAFTIGMLVEIIGVNTGFPFGEYYYTNNLMLLVLGVPLIIGINWFLLSYGIVSLFNGYFSTFPYWLKVVLSAALMTFLDVLIEPFAIHNKLWLWTSDVVPYQNYLSWFIIAFILFALAYKILAKEQNKLAIGLIVIFIMFFGMNNLFYLVL